MYVTDGDKTRNQLYLTVPWFESHPLRYLVVTDFVLFVMTFL
jgi:hypothetical protein